MECARVVTSEFSINRRILDIGLTAAPAMFAHLHSSCVLSCGVQFLLNKIDNELTWDLVCTFGSDSAM